MDDVLVNKLSTITRSLKRIKEVYTEAGTDFSKDYTRQDSVILNLQRACEASIDIANYINKKISLAFHKAAEIVFSYYKNLPF